MVSVDTRANVRRGVDVAPIIRPELLGKSNIAWLFPPQSSQYVGMSADLERNPYAKKRLREVDKILGYPLSNIMLNGPEEMLNDTRYTQPALATDSLIRLELYMQGKVDGFKNRPAAVIGHSIGELIEVIGAGGADFETGIKLSDKRGEIFSRHGNNTVMMVVRARGKDDQPLDPEKEALFHNAIQKITDETGAEVSTINSDRQIAISMHRDTVSPVDKILGEYKAQGISGRVLPGGKGFHSTALTEAMDEWGDVLGKVSLRDLNIPMIANATMVDFVPGEDPRTLAHKTPALLQTVEEYKKELIEGVVLPVRYRDDADYALANGITHKYELSSRGILAGFDKHRGEIVGGGVALAALAGVSAAVLWVRHQNH